MQDLFCELADFHAKGLKSSFRHTETVVKTERDLFGDTAFRSTMYGFDLAANEAKAVEETRREGQSAEGEADETMCATVADLLRGCRNLVFFTGAGISRESGVATYRETGGVWEEYDVYTLGSLPRFLENAGAVWDMQRELAARVANSEPNAGHIAIAEFEGKSDQEGVQKRHVTVITQNMDGYHQAAGSTNVIEMHGGLKDGAICTGCSQVLSFDQLAVETLPRGQQAVPTSPSCSGVMRPNCISFDQNLDGKVLAQCVKRMSECDAVVVVGTSGVVSPAREMPFLAKANGAKLVVINPEKTTHCQAANVTVRGKGSALAKILPLV